MGFCIDPQDRERNYCENRERLRGSERGQYLFTYHLVVGAQGVRGKRYTQSICAGIKTTKLAFAGWYVVKSDEPYPTTATENCWGIWIESIGPYTISSEYNAVKN